MASYMIEIDDKVLNEQISKILNSALNDELRRKYSDTGREISAAVKDLVYAHKDEIIEKIVSRATAELVKKGLPRLLERIGNDVIS